MRINKTIYPIVACLSIPIILRAQEAPPNILLIITDQHAGPVMTQRGYPYLQNPGINKLADQGVTFTRGYCAFPVSQSSRRSMITGVMASLCTNVTAFPSIGKTLNTAGYETGYFGKWHVGSTDIDLEKDWHGFETYRDGHDDTEITNWSIDFLKEERTEPFFMVTSFQNPHDACELARNISGENDRYHDQPVAESMALEFCPPLPANFDIPPNEAEGFYGRRFQNPGDNYWDAHPTIDWTSTEWRQYIYGYDRLVEMVDRHIEEMVDELDSLGLLENTMIIYTSDHGDGHASHMWNQKKSFYEEAVNVPFILSWKGQTKAGIIDKATLVEAGIDLYPTICKLAGIPIPESLHGMDLSPNALLDANGEPPVVRDYVVSEMEQSIYTGNTPGNFIGRMLVTDKYKYILFDKGFNREQLFDLENDPGELNPVSDNPEYSDQLINCRTMLKEWVSTIGDNFDVDKILTEYESDAMIDAISINGVDVLEFDPAIKEYLINLNYTESAVLAATSVNSNAGVTIIQAVDLWGNAEARTAQITVESENGLKTLIYKITLDVDDYISPDTGSTLTEITINGMPLDGFDPNQFNYSTTLDYTDNVIIEAISGALEASVNILQPTDIWGDLEARTAHILVVSKDASTSHNYHIEVSVTDFLFKTGFIDVGLDVPAAGWVEKYGMISENIDGPGNHGEFEGDAAYKFVRGQVDKTGRLESSFYNDVRDLSFWMFILNPDNTAKLQIETKTGSENNNLLAVISSSQLSATKWTHFSFEIEREGPTQIIFTPTLPYDGGSRFWMDDLSITTNIEQTNTTEIGVIRGNSISIFPNPGSEFIKILNADDIEIKLNIYNMKGQLILTRYGLINDQSININSLESGIYILKIESDSQISTFKFIKN